jgi:tRNA-(ms[2]io[6]A)-hydroxylase
MSNEAILAEIAHFLGCETPDAWVRAALEDQETLLIDHANCEKKAATMGMRLLYKYIYHDDSLKKMSQLAREELLHFEQVIGIMKERNVPYRQLSSSNYAKIMHDEVRKGGADELVDILIIGAFIEARSCERFAKLAPFLDESLARFYRSLLRSEGRHYQDYLGLAAQYSKVDIAERVSFFRNLETCLIQNPDPIFRFHSGVPVEAERKASHTNAP